MTRESCHYSTVSSNDSNSLYLMVESVSADDSGAFECVANNGVGQEAKNTSFLLVRGKYSTYCLMVNDKVTFLMKA